MSEEALRFCSAKGYRDCIQATLREYSSDMAFDLITLMDVIEHADDDRLALANMCSHLEPDGLMIITVPAYKMLWNSNDDFSHHKRRYAPNGLRKVIRDAGLKVQSLFGWNRMMFLPTLFYYRIFGPGKMRNNLDAIPSFMNGVLYGLLKAENVICGDRNMFPGVSIVALCGRQK